MVNDNLSRYNLLLATTSLTFESFLKTQGLLRVFQDHVCVKYS